MGDNTIQIKLTEARAKTLAGTIALYLSDDIPSQEDQLDLKIFMRELAEAKAYESFYPIRRE